MKKKETIWKVVLEYQHVLQSFTQYYSSEVFFFQYLQDILSPWPLQKFKVNGT